MDNMATKNELAGSHNSLMEEIQAIKKEVQTLKMDQGVMGGSLRTTTHPADSAKSDKNQKKKYLDKTALGPKGAGGGFV